MNILRTESDNPDFRLLIKELDNDLNRRYGKKQSEYDGYNEIEFIKTVVLIYDNGIPLGCGCFKPFDNNTVEIKRMYLKSQYRGKGIADLIIGDLEKWAKEYGYKETVLETGKGQPEAIRSYTKKGYKIIPNYGQYVGMENSVCMKKELAR